MIRNLNTNSSIVKEELQPKICLTAAALIIHRKKVLFIKHKKLKIWFAPGGHIEANELPHLAAEREAFEETGLKVEVFDPYFNGKSSLSQYLPSPFETNLHWVCRENYQKRIASPKNYQPISQWSKGCEQHLGFLYLAKPLKENKFTLNKNECDDINWFSYDEVMSLETPEDIKQEVRHAFFVLSSGFKAWED